MMYNKRFSVLPPDLKVGSKVGVLGDGLEIYEVTRISNTERGVDIELSCGWREPLSKIYMLRGRSHSAAISDPTSWIETAIGECDKCGIKFPDSCVYHKIDGQDICNSCKERYVNL